MPPPCPPSNCALAGAADLASPGMALLALAVLSAAAQPWVLRIRPASSSSSGSSRGPAVWVHLTAPLLGAGSFALVLVWGLVGVRAADRPEAVHTEAGALLGLLPVVVAAGLAGRWYLAGPCAAPESAAKPSDAAAAGAEDENNGRRPLLASAASG